MKKILGAFIAITMCTVMFSFAVSAAGLTWSLSVPSGTANVNDEFQLVVKLDANSGLACMKQSITFDPALLEYVPYDSTALDNGDYEGPVALKYTLVYNQNNAATGTITWAGARSANATSMGEFMYLNFRVKSSDKAAAKITLTTDTATTATNVAVPCNTPDTTLYLNGYDPNAPTTYALNFDKNTTDDVTSMPSAQTLNANTEFSLSGLTTPVRSGYDFLGWSTDTTSANIVTKITLTDAGKTLYAIWQAKAPSTYTLSFNKNTIDNVTSMPAVQTLNVNTGFDLSTLTAPSRFGYDFLGWSTDTTSANIVTTITLTDANKTLYAIWKLKEVPQVTQDPTSTRLGKKEIRDMFGNLIRTEDIPMLPHFGTQRAKQVSQGSTATSPTTTVRLIMGINSLEYTKAGFIVAAMGDLNKTDYSAATDKNTVLINESTAYTSITADGQTYTAADFGAKYIIAIEIKDFPLAAYGNNMRVQGFVIGMDGTYHYDTASIIKVSDLFAK